MQYMPKPASVRWHMPAFLLLALILATEILGPTVRKPLWYDDLDGWMLGKLALTGAGVDDSHPWPLDYRALDANGHNRVYQQGWIWLNALSVQTEVPHSLWRVFHVSMFILSLAWLTLRRLTGVWRFLPLLAFIFADMPLRVGSTVRTYSLAALGLTLFSLAWDRHMAKQKPWPLILSLVALWQLSLLALAYALCGMAFSMLVACKTDGKAWIKHWPIAITLGLMGACQSWIGWPNDSSWFTMVHDGATRFLSQWHTLNSQGIAIATLLLSMSTLFLRRSPLDNHQGLFLGMSLSSLLLFPYAFEAYRGIWCIMILPILWVECTRVLSGLGKPGLIILILTVFTNIPAWFISRTLPLPKANFIDTAIYSQGVLKLAPLAALHESLHRKTSKDEEDFNLIAKAFQPGDSMLYEFSRLSLMARLHWELGLPTTHMFPPEHPYAVKHPDSVLVMRKRPCWVLLPIGVDPQVHKQQFTADPTARIVSDRVIYLP